jgi:hypothetical protein
MTGPRAPVPLARAAVGLAVRPLPELDDRLRYRAEFTADLATLPALSQLRYAAGVLSQTFALRAALDSEPTRSEEDAMTVTTRRRFYWQCRLFGAHRWVSRSAEDGSRFVACSRCGKEKEVYTGHIIG